MEYLEPEPSLFGAILGSVFPYDRKSYETPSPRWAGAAFAAFLFAIACGACHLMVRRSTRGSMARVWFVVGLFLFILVIPLLAKLDNVVLDASLPMASFLASFRVLQIGFCLEDEEVKKWNMLYTSLHLFTFPRRETSLTSWQARRQAMFYLMQVILPYTVLAAVIVRCIPLWEDFQHFSSFQSHAYYMIVGIAVTVFMISSVDGCFKILQLAYGVEMKPMFYHVEQSTSPKDFWGRRWNLAIRDLFHSVIFQALSSTSSSSRQAKASMAALLIFFTSGCMHLYINYCYARQTDLSNLYYFMAHSALCFIQVTAQRSFPVLRHIPKSISIVLCLICLSETQPLFLSTYLRTGFFEGVKEFYNLFPPFRVNEVVWLAGRPR